MMADFIERLRELDRIEPPDVRSDVERLGPLTPKEPGPSLPRRAAILFLALALAVAGFMFVDRAFRGRAVREPGQSPSPMISGRVRNGLIAFGCGYHICTVMPDGSAFNDLIDPYDKVLVLAAYSPVFSPDGSRIAFRGYPKGAMSGGANYDIYVMGTDGSDVSNLTGPDDPQGQGYAQWSPDGSMIAYEGDDGLYVMSADGSDQRKLADGANPTWSPDGSWIAFVMGRDHGADLWKIHPDGTGLTQLTQSTGWDELPVWSPDGSRIAFLREKAIYVVNDDGTGLSVVADIKGAYPFQPQWSPDGTMLAFEVEMPTPDAEATGERNYDIFRVNDDGTGIVDLTPTTDITENYPIWSPDGTKIAYGASQLLSGENAGSFDLYTMNPDGAGIERLTTDAGLGVEFDISWQSMIATDEIPSATPSPSLSAPAPLTRGTAQFDPEGGMWILTPPDWTFLAHPSGPEEPKMLFAIASYPIERGGECVPTKALDALPPDGVLAWVLEYHDTQGNDFPTRPDRFSLDPSSLAAYECSGSHATYMFRFQDAGRYFQVHVALGDQGSDDVRDEMLASLSSLVVDRCPPAQGAGLVSEFGTLSPDNGLPGDRVTLSGPTGRDENWFWAPLERIEVWWSSLPIGVPEKTDDKQLLASVDPGEDCSFSVSFRVPDVPAGSYMITVLAYWDPTYEGASGFGLMGERTFAARNRQ
jgi:Tol biopolymer transport system component